MIHATAESDAPHPVLKGRLRFHRLLFWLGVPLIPLSIFALGIAWQWHSVRDQRNAVVALTSVGAGIHYKSEWKCGTTSANHTKWPSWLVNLLGKDFFDDVATVEFPPQTTDESLQLIKHLDQLEGIELSGTAVTDAGLRHLKGLRSLQSIRLLSTRVTDAGLQHLTDLTSLKELHLGQTSVTDGGEQRLLQAIPGCRIFRVSRKEHSKGPITMSSNVDRLTIALRDMLTRSEGEPFVIIEERQSKKFVQFTGSAKGGLLLDLPVQTLSQEERVRAQKLFVSLGGLGLEEWDVYDKPNGIPVGKQAGFQLELGNDPGRAAEVALRVFREVYEFPSDFERVLTEN